MTKTKKKVQMPGSIKNKLQAAIAMLLVSTILLVSSTYAWFTLSTAPEVTGISTSVGANGNLEIALLTTATYANTEDISSSAGDSSATQSVTKSNITWGNLIDLSDTSYGLSTISLMPASLNSTSNTDESTGKTTVTLDSTSLLKTPTYGADGRVATVTGNTVSAINTTKGFEYTTGGTQSYGVRAVGTTSNLTTRQIAFSSAKNNVTAKSNASSATSSVKNAVNANVTNLILVAASVNGTATNVTLTAEQQQSMLNIAKGAQSSLNAVVSVYANALAAYVSSSAFSYTVTDASADGGSRAATDEEIALLANTIAAITDAATLKARTEAGNLPAGASEALEALATAQDNVASAITTFTNYDSSTTDYITLKTAIGYIAGGISATKDVKGDTETTTEAVSITDYSSALTANDVYFTSGAVAVIADYAGTYDFSDVLNIHVHAGEATDTNKLTAVATAVNAYNAPTGDATATISDAYGYVLDFAFRTNASESNLLLQTDAVNRVYSGETDDNLATQGSGSTISFSRTDGLSAEQAEKLLKAIRIVFYNPGDYTVYATAGVDTVTDNAGTSTASLKLLKASTTTDSTDIVLLGKNAYEAKGYKLTTSAASTYNSTNTTGFKATLTAAEYAALTSESTTGEGTEGNLYVLGKSAYEADGTGYVLKSTSAYNEHTAMNYSASLTDVQYNALDDTTVKATTLGKDAYEAVSETTGEAPNQTTTVTGYKITDNAKNQYASAKNCTNYAEELTVAQYNALKATTGTATYDVSTTTYVTYGANESQVITSLAQNTVQKVSVLVYLEGEDVDNTTVNNATASGQLTLNLQFSSSASLTPMNNTALKQMTASTTTTTTTESSNNT
jgi:hypothetical protein